MPRQAHKSNGTQPLLSTQTPAENSPKPTSTEDIDTLIAKAQADMERAAKSLDFLAAARFRDQMYELMKLKEK